MTHVKRWMARLLLALLAALGCMAGAAQAQQKVLILATPEGTTDYANTAFINLKSEFTNAGASVTSLNTLNTAGVVTAATFAPTSGPYDLVILVSTYLTIHQTNMDAIQAAINSRAAKMFALFIDGCQTAGCQSNMQPFVNLMNGVTSESMSLGYTQDWDFSTSLNPISPYYDSFSGLNPMRVGWVTYINNVPADNVLYKPWTQSPPQLATTAVGAFFPRAQTGGGNGACLFAVTDSTLLTDVFGIYQGYNRGKFAAAFLNAANSGACDFPSVGKAFQPTVVAQGATSTLTITLTNPRLVAAGNVQLADTLPAPLQVGGAATTTCGGTLTALLGGNTVRLTGATIPAGSGTVPNLVAGTCTVTVPVTWPNTAGGMAACKATAPGNTVTNTITPPGGFSTDAGQVPDSASATLTCNPQLDPVVPQVSVTKTTTSTTVVPGGSIVYTVTVSNTGSVSANGTTVSDPLPAGISAMAWTCRASAGACPAANGSGVLSQTIADFPAGAVLTYTLTATVGATPGATVVNTATVTPANGGVCAPGNTVAPCTSSASVSAPPAVAPVPTLGQWALALLAAALGALAWRQQRARLA